MGIYVYKNEQQLGPYTKEEITTSLEDGLFSPSDTAWTSGLLEWTSLGSIMLGSRVPCPQCKGDLLLRVEYPQRGTGLIIIALGILLAPVCIGLFFIIWGFVLALGTKSQWHCRNCGRLFPA